MCSLICCLNSGVILAFMASLLLRRVSSDAGGILLMVLKVLKAFFEHSKIDASKAKVKTYDDGITFISAECSQWNLQRAKSFNPLRAAHPLGNISITAIRNVVGSSCPSVSTLGEKPKIKVGVFDGGADASHPLLNGYIKVFDGTVEPPDQECIAHGTGVCSTIMYGNLSGKNGNDTAATIAISSTGLVTAQQ